MACSMILCFWSRNFQPYLATHSIPNFPKCCPNFTRTRQNPPTRTNHRKLATPPHHHTDINKVFTAVRRRHSQKCAMFKRMFMEKKP